MLNYIAVFVGGGLGSVCRYALGQLLPTAHFPWATLIANTLACFVLGFLTGYLLKNNLDNHLKILISIGFCGGFSTFSTFSSETLKLSQNGSSTMALIYILLSIITGIMAVVVGGFLGKFL